MRDIEKVLEQKTIEDFVHELFNQAFTEKEFIINKKGKTQETLFGCYVTLDKLSDKEFSKLHTFFKLIYSAQSKVVCLFGDTNESDHANREQTVREFLYSALLEAFITKNHKLEEGLRVENMEDVRRIVMNKSLSRKMCNYILSNVEGKCRNHMKAKGNPDFYKCNNKLVPVYYVYLDRDVVPCDNLSVDFDKNDSYTDEVLKYEELDDEMEKYEVKSGDFTSFIFENVELSVSEQKFVDAFLMYGKRKDGTICDLEDTVLYSRQNANNYYNKLRKKILKFIENNEDVYFDEVSKRYKMR